MVLVWIRTGRRFQYQLELQRNMRPILKKNKSYLKLLQIMRISGSSFRIYLLTIRSIDNKILCTYFLQCYLCPIFRTVWIKKNTMKQVYLCAIRNCYRYTCTKKINKWKSEHYFSKVSHVWSN